MNAPKRYKRKKFDRKITAIQFKGDINVDEVSDFCDGHRVYEDGYGVRIEYPHPSFQQYERPIHRVEIWNWVVKDKEGNISVIGPDTFDVVYGEVE